MDARPCLPTLIVAVAMLLCGCEPAEAPAAVAPTAAVAAGDDGPAPQADTAAVTEPKVAVLEQTLAYGEAGRSNLVGYLAMPADAAEPLPGVIVIHEWWGLDDAVKGTARRLAGEGYVVLAVDLFGGATAATPDAAQTLMAELLSEPDATAHNVRQAYAYLEKYAFAPRIASVGFGLGGGWSLQAALLEPGGLDAVVVYYGQVIADRERLAAIEAPVLGFFGGLDASIPVKDVRDFRAALQELGKNAEVLIYPQANHAFANAGGANYDAVAADESWQKTLTFLARHLKLDTPTQ